MDTWASTAAGAFALSENNLYTVDAFRDYLQHLTGDGVIAITRWGFDPPRESLRLLSLAREALRQIGQNDAWRHIIVGREGSTKGWGAKDTVLIARNPFSPEDIERAKALFAAAGMTAIYLPGVDLPQSVLRTAAHRQSRRVRAQLHFRHHAGHRQPAVLLLHRAAARPVGVRQDRLSRSGRLQSQQGRAAAVQPAGGQPVRHAPDPAGAAAGAGHAPSARTAACWGFCSTSCSSARATF